MESYFAEIENINNDIEEIESSFTKLLDNQYTMDEFIWLESKLYQMKESIKMNGVSKVEAEFLAKTGFEAIDPKYFTEMKSYVNADVALESLRNIGGKLIGIVIAALAAVLAFLVSKVLAWIFKSEERNSSRSASASKETPAKLDEFEYITITRERITTISSNSRNSDVISLLCLSNDYITGSKIRELFTDITENGNAIIRVMEGLSVNTLLLSSLEGLGNATGSKAIEAVRETAFQELNRDSEYHTLVSKTFPTLLEVMGSLLNYDENLDLAKTTAYRAKLVRKTQFTEVFDENLSKDKKDVQLPLKDSIYGKIIDKSKRDKLESLSTSASRFKNEPTDISYKVKDLAKALGIVYVTDPDKNSDAYLKQNAILDFGKAIVNQKYIYPAKYLTKVVNVAIKLAMAHSKTKTLSVDYKTLVSKLLSIKEENKINKLCAKYNLPKVDFSTVASSEQAYALIKSTIETLKDKVEKKEFEKILLAEQYGDKIAQMSPDDFMTTLIPLDDKTK